MMIEASPTQFGQINLGMVAMDIKRPRGRPRIENPNNRRGMIRGARQGTIKQFKDLCIENHKDSGEELEKLLRQAIDDMAGPEAIQQILKEMDEEDLLREERRERLCQKIKAFLEERGRGPPDGVPYEEALERSAQRIASIENRTEYMALLEPSSRRLAADYHTHWQTIKQALRKRVEEILAEEGKRTRRGEQNEGA